MSRSLDMASESNRSGGSSNSEGRELASPPYDGANNASLPPQYQSQTTLDAKVHKFNSPGRGKERSLSEHDTETDTDDDVVQPRATMTPTGPRIAVSDPLADMRFAQSVKPEVLADKSGGPLRWTVDPPSDGRPALSRRNSDASSVDDGDGYFDEFDWSEDEEERQANAADENQAHAVGMRRRKLSPFSIIKWLATTFLGNLLVSAALAVPVIVIQFVYREQQASDPTSAARRDYIADNIQAWFIWAAFNLHVEWWIHLGVELFPRVATAVFSLVWGNISQKELTWVEYYNAIKTYIKPIYYAALSWGSWAIIFNSIYQLYTRTNPETESRARYLYRIYQVIQFFFFLTLTICAEKILLKTISMRFHKTAFADRISKVTKALQVFDHLKDYRPKLVEKGNMSPFMLRVGGARTPASGRTPTSEHGGEKQPESKQSTGYFGKKTHAHKRPAESASIANDGAATPSAMSFKSSRSAAANAVRNKATQTATLARVAMVDPTHLLTDKTVGVGLDVNSPAEARRLARSIYKAFRGKHRRNYLIPSDFEVAYPDAAAAKEAFEVFDEDRNGDISATEMRNTIVEAYKERRFISKSLEDTSHALSQLDSIFLVIAALILIFEAFAIFNVSVGNSLTTIYTLAIGASFIFKESAQNIFDSIVFIFVTHPFDTGDRVVVDGAVMVVQKMSLLSCQFLLWDNTQLFISNSMLSQMFITNYRRSGYQWECATVQVAYDTPLDSLDAVQADMIHWLQTEPERMFEPSTAIVPQTIDFMRSITVTIGMTHRGNYQDWGARWYRRNAFFAAVCYYMKKHGVRYMNSNQPILYWDPPSYDASEAAQADEGTQRDDDVEQNLEDSLPPTVNDNYAVPPRAEGSLLAVSGAAPETVIKPKTFMNFSPPPDEVRGSEIRIRKARQGRKGITQQGGEG